MTTQLSNRSHKCESPYQDELNASAMVCWRSTLSVSPLMFPHQYVLIQYKLLQSVINALDVLLHEKSTCYAKHFSNTSIGKNYATLKYSLRKSKVFVSLILRYYLTKKGRVRKFFYCLIRIKESCVRELKGSHVQKFLGFCKLK